MDKYKELIKLLETIFGKSAVGKSLGTRTNVVRFPKGKQGLDPTTRHFDVEATSLKNPDLVDTIENSIANRMGDIPNMNDQELLTYTENVRRLASHRNPPMADVVEASSKQPVTGEGLEKLINEQGLIASPKTPLGSAQFNIKRAEQEMNKIIKENDLDSLLKGAGRDQLSWNRLHNEGLIRAVTRQILSEDIRAGKIKSLTLDDLGTSREPIDYFRKIYGEGALEQLDSLTPEFNRLSTEQEAAKLARSKFKFEPNETRLKGSASYEDLEKAKETKDERTFFEKIFGINKKEPEKAKVLDIKEEGTKRKSIDELIEEHNRNSERMALTDEEGGSAITYTEFQDLAKRNKELEDLIEGTGVKPKEEVKPEGIVIPFKKKNLEPEEKADGGSAGLDYLLGFDNRPQYAGGGDVKKILDLIAKANKELKGKKSMETINPKTGEVTIPKEPIKTARTTADIEKEIDELSTTPITTLEKKRKYNDLHSEFINSLDPGKRNKNLDYRRKGLDLENRLLLKAEEQGLDFDTFEKLRQGLYGPRKQQTLNYIKTGKVNVEPVEPATTFEEVQNRYRTAAKAADEIFPNYDTPKTAASELANVMAEQKYGKVFDEISGDKQSELYSEAYNYITSVNKLPKVSPERVPPEVLQNKMNEVLNAYDKSMFIKNEQGMVDVTNPENIAKMEELLRKDHPELHNQLKKLADDVSQKETLLDFDVTGREPNAKGGQVGIDYLLGM